MLPLLSFSYRYKHSLYSVYTRVRYVQVSNNDMYIQCTISQEEDTAMIQQKEVGCREDHRYHGHMSCLEFICRRALSTTAQSSTMQDILTGHEDRDTAKSSYDHLPGAKCEKASSTVNVQPDEPS